MAKRTNEKEMEIPEILKSFERNDGHFQRDAVESAIQKREEVIPYLLEILQSASKNQHQLLEDLSFFAHFYAMFLLAQFRVKEAYPILYDFFSVPGELSLTLTGDLVTESLPNILASVANGDDTLIKRLIENPDNNEYVRDAALKALVIMVAVGEKSRDEVIHYFQQLFRGGLERDYSYVWTSLVFCSADLFPEEVYEDIKKVYEEDLVDRFFIRFQDVEEFLQKGKEKVIARLKEPSRFKLIENTIQEMELWACFKNRCRTKFPAKKAEHVEVPKTKTAPIACIGRNDPCPCNSGKKYKKCCGAN